MKRITIYSSTNHNFVIFDAVYCGILILFLSVSAQKHNANSYANVYAEIGDVKSISFHCGHRTLAVDGNTMF